MECCPDDGLDELLDVALDKFDAPRATKASPPLAQPSSQPSSSQGPTAVPSSLSHKSSGSAPKFDPLRRKKPPQRQSEPYGQASSQASKQPVPNQGAAWQQHSGDPPPAVNDIAESLAALLEGLAKGTQDGSGGDVGRASQFSETLECMNVAADAAAGAGGAAGGSSAADDDAAGVRLLAKVMESMQQSSTASGDASGESFEQTVMRNLLCKDVLCEPMKDIAGQYPAWLEKNASSLPQEEREKYEKQLEHINGIVELLERHGDSKYDELLEKLDRLQALGQPPGDIVQHLSPDDGGFPGLPNVRAGAGGEDAQCCVQ